jgi:hypothetical protein
MRNLMLWRTIAMLLLMAGTLTGPLLDRESFVEMADDGDDDGNGNGDDDEPGNGNDNRNKDKKKDKDKASQVEQSVAYRVELACSGIDDGLRSECLFTVVEPDGGKQVTHLVVPEETVCAGVVEGDFSYVDPDPNVNVSGYRATGIDGPLRLVLEGEVAAGGSATYWLKTGDGVFPAMGPGLDCEGAAASDPVATAAATAPADTGSVAVQTFDCLDVPVDQAGFDWYGACDPAGTGRRYALTPVDGGGASLVADTAENGTASFEGLAAGTWTLDDEGDSWCHAESDNVDAEGQVVVETGARSTIWLFYCAREGGS